MLYELRKIHPLHQKAPMPRHKPKAHELTTEQAIKKMFPKKVREAAADEAQKSRKEAKKKNIDQHPS
jgi:hypothetical protein